MLINEITKMFGVDKITNYDDSYFNNTRIKRLIPYLLKEGKSFWAYKDGFSIVDPIDPSDSPNDSPKNLPTEFNWALIMARLERIITSLKFSELIDSAPSEEKITYDSFKEKTLKEVGQQICDDLNRISKKSKEHITDDDKRLIETYHNLIELLTSLSKNYVTKNKIKVNYPMRYIESESDCDIFLILLQFLLNNHYGEKKVHHMIEYQRL